MLSRHKLNLSIILACAIMLFGCRATVRNVEPGEDVRYTAEYSYGDLNVLSKEMADRILKTAMATESSPPVMIIYGIENRTDEHIDTKALTDAMRTILIKSGKFQFINEARREDLIREMEYQNQGFITADTRIKFGRQIGAKYMLTGSLKSISAEELKQVRLKKKSLKYYRLTLEITDINTNLIVWTDEQEIVREQARPFIGW